MADEDGQHPTTSAATDQAADDALGYEQARDALLDVVRRLETGGITLEESLALWERGERLAKVCQRRLDGARARLDAALAAEQAEQAERTATDGDQRD
ncbi:exodeoxyribonuclease VII small subunit [Kitasatospora sp. NPDC052896]|uniref:exodeoxyribonuclease VII small subunit n=1 Tax=Kitasatospora sp. NPDC052896 TaxID=3364061 RepID=UPI0037C744DB